MPTRLHGTTFQKTVDFEINLPVYFVLTLVHKIEVLNNEQSSASYFDLGFIMSTPQPPKFFFVTNALVLQAHVLNLKSSCTPPPLNVPFCNYSVISLRHCTVFALYLHQWNYPLKLNEGCFVRKIFIPYPIFSLYAFVTFHPPMLLSTFLSISFSLEQQ